MSIWLQDVCGLGVLVWGLVPERYSLHYRYSLNFLSFGPFHFRITFLVFKQIIYPQAQLVGQCHLISASFFPLSHERELQAFVQSGHQARQRQLNGLLISLLRGNNEKNFEGEMGMESGLQVKVTI